MRLGDCGSVSPSVLTPFCADQVLSLTGVLGRALASGAAGEKKAARPTTGDSGGVAVPLPKFSNLDRSDETGLMDDSSLLSPLVLLSAPSSMCATAWLVCAPPSNP